MKLKLPGYWFSVSWNSYSKWGYFKLWHDGPYRAFWIGRLCFECAVAMIADNLLCKLRADLINKRFCRGINKPQAFVKVLNVYRAGRGFKVMFRYGDDGPVVYCGYTNFLKRYPEELTHE